MSRRHLSRQVQAFESLLNGPEGHDDRQPGTGRKLNGRPTSRRQASRGNNQGPIKGFTLKEDCHKSPGSSGSGQYVLDDLIQLFQDALPPDAINDVFIACNRSCDSTMAALLSLTSQRDGGRKEEAKEEEEEEGEGEQEASASSFGLQHVSLWDRLPPECKTMILDQLSLRDLSRLAVTSREFAAYVRAQRKNLKTIVVPPNLTMRALQGLVTSFPDSSGVNLSRWGPYLRFPHDFADVAEAIAKGVAGRADNSAAVEALSLARCALATDGDVATMCSNLPHLRSLDLSRCTKLTDDVLSLISAYRRQSAAVGAEEEEEEQKEKKAWNVNGPNQRDPPSTAAATGKIERPRDAALRIANANSNAKLNERTVQYNVGGGLEDINLSGTTLSSSAITSLLRGGSRRARDLITLDVSRCPNVMDIVPGPLCPIQHLKASGCGAIKSITLALDSNSRLKSLNVADCKSLTELIISSAPALEDLNVSGCGALHTLNLRCPRLFRLRASGCSSLGAQGPVGMSNCQKLREVSFFGCRALDSGSIESMVPCFARLESLDLSGCISVGRIVATGQGCLSKLQRLTVDGCTVLRTLTVLTPALVDLSARGCCRLIVSERLDYCCKISCCYFPTNTLLVQDYHVFCFRCRRFPSLVHRFPP